MDGVTSGVAALCDLQKPVTSGKFVPKFPSREDGACNLKGGDVPDEAAETARSRLD